MTGFVPSEKTRQEYLKILQGYYAIISSLFQKADLNLDALIDVVHKIKGSAKLYGYPELSRLGKALIQSADMKAIEQTRELGEHLLLDLEKILKPLQVTIREGESARVLVIDDDSSIANLLEEFLNSLSLNVKTASDVGSGIEIIKSFHPHVILLDYLMPEGGGSRVLSWLEQSGIQTRVILMSAIREIEVGLPMGNAIQFLRKPFSLNELTLLLQPVLPASEKLAHQA